MILENADVVLTNTSDNYWKNDPKHFLSMKQQISPELKNEILKWGPCQPVAYDLPGKAFKKNKNGHHFNSSWYYNILDDGSKIHRDWLSFSPNLDKAFCLHCMLFGINLNSMSSMAWTKKGFSTWKNGSMCIKSHECSEDHITSSIKVKTRKTCPPLLPLLENRKKWKLHKIDKQFLI